jgi:peroxiredoxin-like protein
MPTLHDYPVKVEWTGGRNGKGRFAAQHSGSSLDIAVPPEFMGPGGGASPEELLTSAITSCYTMTFGIIAENRKVPVDSVQVEATGQVEQNGPSFKYTSITIHPKIVLSADATDEQVKLAEEMAHKADAYCIVTNAIRNNVQITVEPEVRKA